VVFIVLLYAKSIEFILIDDSNYLYQYEFEAVCS
jgi:hypothetical protein